MSKAEMVLKYANDNNGIVTSKQVAQLGIERWALHDLEKSGKIFAVQRGVYITEQGYPDDFFLLQERYPKGIYSHETALYLLGFSDRVPIGIQMTFLKGVSTSRMKADQIRPVTLGTKDLFEVGITSVLRPGGTKVQVYDIERTLVDLLRPRYDADIEQLVPALKRYASSPERDIPKLVRYARLFGLEEKISTYMGVLL